MTFKTKLLALSAAALMAVAASLAAEDWAPDGPQAIQIALALVDRQTQWAAFCAKS